METITIKSYKEIKKLAIDKDRTGFKLPDGSYFSGGMKGFCGKTISVEDAEKLDDIYRWSFNDGEWFFSEIMVETKSDNFKLIYDILNS